MAKAVLTDCRYSGKECPKHPGFAGIRMISNRKCVECLYLKSLVKIKRIRSVPDRVLQEAKSAKIYRDTHKEGIKINGLNYKARKSGKGTLSKGLFSRLFDLQNGMCGCDCGRQLGNDVHMDHWMPFSAGWPERR